MGDTPVCTIDATGIHKPAFQDCLAYYQNKWKGIYGQDIVIDNDSQDGQLLGLFATSLDDANAMAVAVYNSFRPGGALGVGLSTIVKINGIRRAVSSNSSVDLLLVGQVGKTIVGGYATDDDGNQWVFPGLVTFPPEGQLTITAICSTAGAVGATPNTITGIGTPTQGWQSVTNPTDADPGAPVEGDPALRQRQTVSTMLPSRTVLDGIIGAVAAVPGVTRYRGYENDTRVTDANGQGGNTIALVVDGGDAAAIAALIALKKTPGGGTFGTTAVTVTDVNGIPHVIRFFRPTEPPVTWSLTVKAFAGFTTITQTAIAQALSDWTNALGIGGDLQLNRAFAPIYGVEGSSTFEVVPGTLKVARDGQPLATNDLNAAYNEAFACTPASVNILPTA